MPDKYNFNLANIFKHSFAVLKKSGFYKPDPTEKYGKLYTLHRNICITIWVSHLLSQIIYAVLNRNNLKALIEVMSMFITFSLILFKLLVLQSNMDKVENNILKLILQTKLFKVRCLEHLKMAEAERILLFKVFVICIILGLTTDVFYGAAPLFQEKGTLPTKGWFPFDPTIHPFFELAYFFQNIVMVYNTVLCVSGDLFATNLMEVVGLQCDMLCYTLENLDKFHVENGELHEIDADYWVVEKDFSQRMTENLVVCIKHHFQIKRVAKNIEEILNFSIFIFFLGGSLIMCLCLYQMNEVDSIASFEFALALSYSISMLTDQFVYCWFGNELTFKSGRLFEAAYKTPWCECDAKFRRMLVFFLLNLKDPIEIYVGNLFPITTAVYVNVIRSSYSYFTLLKNF